MQGNRVRQRPKEPGLPVKDRTALKDDPEMIRLLCLLTRAEDRLDMGAHTVRETSAFD